MLDINGKFEDLIDKLKKCQEKCYFLMKQFVKAEVNSRKHPNEDANLQLNHEGIQLPTIKDRDKIAKISTGERMLTLS